MHDDRHNDDAYWWQALLALPDANIQNRAYRRLERVFRDRTLKLGEDWHQLTDRSHETHFTVCLWENFSLFEPRSWLKLLWRSASLGAELGEIRDCNWSYEWVAKIGKQERNLDITLRYEDERGSGILVVEAKKPGVQIKHAKDLNPRWYRDIPEFQEFDRFSFLYLVDSCAREVAQSQVDMAGLDVAFLSWEELAAVQIECTGRAGLSAAIRSFVAASLYQQYRQLGIAPGVVPLDYLREEPSMQDILMGTSKTLSGRDWHEPHWKA